ncbi:MAG: serine/threonine protein kinase [Planctomycetia bacterium]|nr:serine/threonine protein kinase [Planctomycetia bacterium]
MSPADPTFDQLSLPAKQRVDAACARFETAWRDGHPDLAAYLGEVPEAEQPALLLELLMIELEFRRRQGESPTVEEYLVRFPASEAVLRRALRSLLMETDPDAVSEEASEKQQPLPPSVPGYNILHELGRGGMGVVYCARHTPLNRVVALKFILPGRQSDAQQRERFRREAEVIARLRHPNIVQIFDLGVTDAGCYLTLEFADGGSLRQRLNGSPMNPVLVARLMEPLVRAVMHAHRHGVIHRDIKPANILLSISGDSIFADNRPLPDIYTRGQTLYPVQPVSLRDCTPKLSDFGLARLLGGDPSGETAAAGTPAYMSPEQAAGEEACTPAVDMWALGATMYELLTGRPPFKGASARETLRLVLESFPVPPRTINPAIPGQLEAICLKCLQKNPADRTITARDLAQELHQFLHQPRRLGWRWLWSAMAVLVALAATAYALWCSLSW